MLRWAVGRVCAGVWRWPASTSRGQSTAAAEAEEDELYDRVEVLTSGSERAVLKSYMTFFLTAAGHLGVDVAKAWKPHRIHSRKTVLRSAYVHKDHRVQYETQTHYRCFELRHLTGSTLSTFLEYTQRNLPEGVAMVVTKDRRERLPTHIRPQPPPSPSP